MAPMFTTHTSIPVLESSWCIAGSWLAGGIHLHERWSYRGDRHTHPTMTGCRDEYVLAASAAVQPTQQITVKPSCQCSLINILNLILHSAQYQYNWKTRSILNVSYNNALLSVYHKTQSNLFINSSRTVNVTPSGRQRIHQVSQTSADPGTTNCCLYGSHSWLLWWQLMANFQTRV